MSEFERLKAQKEAIIAKQSISLESIRGCRFPNLQTEPRYQLAVQLYEYRWNRMGRKGRICRVLARGKMNSCLIEFTDGFRAVTSRNAIRKLK